MENIGSWLSNVSLLNMKVALDLHMCYTLIFHNLHVYGIGQIGKLLLAQPTQELDRGDSAIVKSRENMQIL